MLKPKAGEVRKPTRTISGITPVAVMLPPRKCNHGMCVYCPNLNVPQSYTPKSPVVMRAMEVKYDAYEQVRNRLKAFKAMNHPTDKVELIIMGGTFLEYPEKFQEEFIKGCYDGLNGVHSSRVIKSQEKNEIASHRCVALCIETRPDVCSKHIKKMRDWGVTRVELGVQIIDDEIYEKVKRGHIVQDVVDVTEALRNAGFKIGYHLMVNLPGSNIQKDLKKFKEIFTDSRFKPDQLKLYPCQVMPCSELENLYWKGKYKLYSEKELINLLVKLKSIVPRYCRVMRVMREIPPEYLVAGTIRIDLRKVVQEKMINKGKECKCIRCREIGIAMQRGKSLDTKSIKLCRIDYDASCGKEVFLSFEDVKNDILIGLLRLRIPSNQIVKEIDKKTAIVREMHIYGTSIKIGEKNKELGQHKGYGKLLLREAERIAKEEFDMDKITIIAGIGVREYFYSQGYRLDGTYVSKGLNK